MMTSKRRNSDFFSRRFHCVNLDSSNSALLLDSSRSQTSSFSSSCVRMCGYGAEDLSWETCGSVDAGGSGEPKVNLPSPSSEWMVSSFGGSRAEIHSPCGTGRRADGIFRYTIAHFFFFVMPPETGGTIQKQQSVAWLHGFLQTIVTANGIASLLPFSHCKMICCTFTAAYVRGPGFVLVADLASEIQMIRGDGLSLPCKHHFTTNVTRGICTINTVTSHHYCWINTAEITLRYLWGRSKRVWCTWWADAIWRNILKSFNVFHF
jgi:hypothetical protein